jgi:hypothetical protein
VIRRNLSVVLTAAAIISLLLVAFILALTQHKLPELALELTIYVFAITLGVFVVQRTLVWREKRRWLAAKYWLYMILLEQIDGLLKEVLPAKVPREVVETDAEITVYEVAGERIHFGGAVLHRPLQLLVSPGEKDLQSHIFWYARELGPSRYADLARAALSDAREQVRNVLASSGQLMEADIMAMLMSFDQAIVAAIRHIDSALGLRDEKLENTAHPDREETPEQSAEADHELAFATSIIIESVVSPAMKPKAWLEDQMQSQESRAPIQHL